MKKEMKYLICLARTKHFIKYEKMTRSDHLNFPLAGISLLSEGNVVLHHVVKTCFHLNDGGKLVALKSFSF